MAKSLNQSPLSFLRELKCKPSKISDFWRSREHKIPKKPGVYILITKRGITFPYPHGISSVYYIGETNNLHRRVVKEHSKWHSHVKKDNRNGGWIYEARHEYGGVFGGRYCFIQTWQGMTRKKLERLVIREFIKCYHAPPVTNGAQVWGWVKKEL